jgi:DtxR family Mn-dependent transcriptional regulator
MTSSEENYLKTIYHLEALKAGSVMTSQIADRMNTTSASVTDMIKKLSEKNLVDYERYHGVKMTRKGEKMALGVIRRHRLWEVFLTDILKFNWDEVHVLAEELEHVSSDELISRLDAYLGHPRFDPHGDPIPDGSGKMSHPAGQSLSEVEIGQDVHLFGVSDHSPPFLRFLEKKGLKPGVRFVVLEKDEFDQSILIRFVGGETTFLSHQAAQQLLIRHD